VLQWLRTGWNKCPVFDRQHVGFWASLVENKLGFMTTAVFVLNCRKHESVTIRWDVIDPDENVVTTVANNSQFVSPPYALPPVT